MNIYNQKLIVKPTVSFLTTYSDARLFAQTNCILLRTTDSPAYPDAVPLLVKVAAANKAFFSAMSAAADGGRTLTAMKNNRRAELVLLLRQLASLVQTACQGDLTVLLSSGFPHHKPQRQPIGYLPAPTGLTLTFGACHGVLEASSAPVAGAATYNWQLTTAADPTVILQTAQTTAANVPFTGLTPGVVYQVRNNAVGTAGTSNWSNPVTQMAV